MRQLPVVILCALTLTAGSCVRECRCAVTVAPDAEGCVVAEVTTVEAPDDTHSEVLDALATVGKAALDAALSLIF